MRFWGTKQTPHTPVAPDAVTTVNVTSAAQAADYPSGAHMVRVTACSTTGTAVCVVFNPLSTGAAWGTSASATAGSSVSNVLVGGEPKMFQITGDTTGYSIVGSSNAICTLEFWSRGGTT